MMSYRAFILLCSLVLAALQSAHAHSEPPKLPVVSCETSLKNEGVLPPWGKARQLQRLEPPHSLIQRLSLKLGFKPLVQYELHKHQQVLALLYPRSEKQFAQIIFYSHGSSLEVDGLLVAPSLQRLGISHFLFSQMLAIHPRVVSIHTSLVKDNFKAFALKYTELEQHSLLNIQERCEEAVRSTPAYRIRQANGFSHIVDCNPGLFDQEKEKYIRFPSFKVQRNES